MATLPNFTAAGYRFEDVPDLSRVKTRERLSQSAVDGLFRIAEKWRISPETVGELLGGVPRSSVYKLKTAAGTLRQDELTRISYIVGIYKALHILLPAEFADRWMTQPNDHFLFAGRAPVEFVMRNGIPGLQRVRGYLDAARGGR